LNIVTIRFYYIISVLVFFEKIKILIVILIFNLKEVYMHNYDLLLKKLFVLLVLVLLLGADGPPPGY